MEVRLEFDQSDSSAGLFAATYNAFMSGLCVAIFASPKPRDLAAVRIEGRLQDLFDAISEVSPDAQSSCGEPMRELVRTRGIQVMTLTRTELARLVELLDDGILRLGPAQQRDAIAGRDWVEQSVAGGQ